ncbi:MAG: hypothetical protein SFY68_08985 [Candidatus Sumerlaeia bacterium]|nr:hypothetical protein [Candidatus Sumerlaeia bacterium]
MRTLNKAHYAAPLVSQSSAQRGNYQDLLGTKKLAANLEAWLRIIINKQYIGTLIKKYNTKSNTCPWKAILNNTIRRNYLEGSKSNEINDQYYFGVLFCLFGLIALIACVSEISRIVNREKYIKKYQARIIEKHEILNKNNRGSYQKEYWGIIEFIELDTPTTTSLSLTANVYRNCPNGSQIQVDVFDGKLETASLGWSISGILLIVSFPIVSLTIGLVLILESGCKWHLAFTKYL